MTRLRNMLAARFAHRRSRRLLSSVASAGTGTIVDQPIYLSSPSGVRIGGHCYVGPQAYIAADGGLTIEDGVMIGPMVYLQTSSHNFDSVDLMSLPYDHRIQRKPIHIGRYAWLGGRVTVVPGVRIGAGAVIGSGSVVSRDVPDRAIVVGNPAEVIGYRDSAQFDRLAETVPPFLEWKRLTGTVDTWIDSALERMPRSES